MTILYLEWLGQGAGGRTEPISLARVGPDHMQGVISFWAAVLGRGGGNGFNGLLPGCRQTPRELEKS